MLYRNSILQENGCIVNICRVKEVIIKDCHSFNLRFQFIRKNKISKAYTNKKAEIGSS